MKSFPKSLSDKLAQRESANALRKLPVNGKRIDFSSNDYLGFSKSEIIFQDSHKYLANAGIINNGATGSRLISGNHDQYKITEDFISQFHKADSTLVFNSGYDANVGLFSSVPQKGDIILYDEYIHASIRDGIRLSNAKAYKFSHNDVDDLERLLKRAYNTIGENEVYIVTESVFSMDGDSPDLQKLVDLTDEYKALLIIDEAHALGVAGEKGEGLLQSKNLHDKVFARIMTFGKGLGCHGAAVLGSQQLTAYLVNFARSFIYTTGLPPHSLATILTAYKYLENHSYERKALHKIILFFTSEMKRLELTKFFIISQSAIHCAVVPGNEKVKNISSVLQQHNFDVKAILSPTVPQGQERLRFCLHAYNTPQQITTVLELLRVTIRS
ncbi:aminotransferase class I/II-fold pyridoxal phosphate-dependent enzyme [Flavobacterium cerinum]|uniref:8-amino-7-oxononanoate synthase n=1 Tax=Flavobacterium cerinum TaxID=2502784 RepID=A0A3S3RJG8_9FLAO|nr:8-amino-7-oxononanoate synthase [Flavobacterium cerinum]RWX00217.1 8-amino-7-oxononanoate synthase [Flavobacterium cerinum]